MNKPIIGLVLFLMSGLALADCPDISGKWGVQMGESLGGEQIAGIGRGTFRNNGTFVLKFYAAYEGMPEIFIIRGDYDVDSKCLVDATYTIDGIKGDYIGRMTSIIIDEDNMYMAIIDDIGWFNSNVIAERLSEAATPAPLPIL